MTEPPDWYSSPSNAAGQVRATTYQRGVHQPGALTSAKVSWGIACTPFIGIAFGIIGSVTQNLLVVALVPFISVFVIFTLSVVLAAIDARHLREAGSSSAHRAWAMLGPWVYLMVRALRRVSTTPRPGWPQFVVAMVLLVLMLFSWNLAFMLTVG